MVFFGPLEFMLENEESWKWTIFRKNGKPIGLTFSPKYGVFGHFLIPARKWRNLKWTIFGKDGKPIALLFG